MLIMFVITQIMKMFVVSTVESNLTFYMMLFMLLMTEVNLMKNTFNLGYMKFSDDTKMEILLGCKAFITVFCVLKYLKSTSFLDYNIEKAHDATLERVNQTMELFGGRLNLPYDFTYTLLASLASVVTFCTVKLNIRFAYYFYTITKNSSAVLASKQGEEKQRLKSLITALYINFLTPILVTIFYVSPLL